MGVEYVQHVTQARALARDYWFEVLLALLAIVAVLEVILGRGTPGAPTTTLWFSVPAIAILVLPVFARRRFAFAGPAVYWLLAAGISLGCRSGFTRACRAGRGGGVTCDSGRARAGSGRAYRGSGGAGTDRPGVARRRRPRRERDGAPGRRRQAQAPRHSRRGPGCAERRRAGRPRRTGNRSRSREGSTSPPTELCKKA